MKTKNKFLALAIMAAATEAARVPITITTQRQRSLHGTQSRR